MTRSTTTASSRRRNPPPEWFSDFLDECGPGIAKATGAVLTDAGAYGCGADGCVYRTRGRSRRWVVKVTTDEDEGVLAAMLERIRRRHPRLLKGIVAIRAVWGSRFGWRRVTSIVREPVRPLVTGSGRVWVPSRVAALDPRAGQRVYRWADGWHPTSTAQHRRTAEEMLLLPYSRVLGQTLLDLLERGVDLPDIHAGNVGWSISRRLGRPAGTLVVHDFGRARVQRGALPSALPKTLACDVPRRAGRRTP